MHGLTRAKLVSNKVHFLGAVAGSCRRTYTHDDTARFAPGASVFCQGFGGRGLFVTQGSRRAMAARDERGADEGSHN